MPIRQDTLEKKTFAFAKELSSDKTGVHNVYLYELHRLARLSSLEDNEDKTCKDYINFLFSTLPFLLVYASYELSTEHVKLMEIKLNDIEDKLAEDELKFLLEKCAMICCSYVQHHKIRSSDVEILQHFLDRAKQYVKQCAVYKNAEPLSETELYRHMRILYTEYAQKNSDRQYLKSFLSQEAAWCQLYCNKQV